LPDRLVGPSRRGRGAVGKPTAHHVWLKGRQDTRRQVVVSVSKKDTTGNTEAEVNALRAVYANIHLLFSTSTQWRLRLAMLGSILVALMETIGLAVILPLMELVTGGSTTTGTLGRISSFFGNPSRSTLAIILATIVFAAFTLKGLFTILFRWWILGFIAEQEAKTAAELLQRYLTAPYWMHLERGNADRIRNMNDAVTAAYSQFIVGVLSMITEAVNIIGIMVVVLVLKPEPALFAIVYFGLATFIYHRLVRNAATAAGKRMLQSAIESYQVSLHALGGVKEIRVRRKTRYFVDRYAAARAEFAAAKRTSGFLQELSRYVFEIVFIVGVAILTVFAFSGSTSSQAISVLTLFVAAGSQLLPSAARVMGSASATRSGKVSFDLVVAELASFPPSNLDDEETGDPAVLQRELKIEDVFFRYPGTNTDVLKGVTLEIKRGESVAVVGPSGAGKSTLVDLLLGLHKPDRGQISLDSTDIFDELPNWQRAIGVVPQDIYMIDATLRENIAFGEEPAEIDDARITTAVRQAQLDDLVAGVPGGLDTVIGDRGVRLSGGQRQRLGIARALYMQPSLLVLDEATSSLDNETEYLITSTLESLHGSLTIVVIAHRLSTVRHCDRVVMLNNGTIEAIGSFDEVRRLSPTFSRLVALANVESAEDGGVVDLEQLLPPSAR